MSPVLTEDYAYLLVLAVGVQLASADVSLGYHYKPPQISGSGSLFASDSSSHLSQTYGPPAYQIGSGSSSVQYSTGYTDANRHNNYKEQSSSNLGFNNPNYNTFNKFQSTANIGGYKETGGYQPVNFPGNNYYQNTLTSSQQQTYPAGVNQGYQGINNQYYQSTQYQNSQQKYQQSYQVQQQPAQVFKHFYVHAAPEDEEPPKLRQPVVLPPPQKHYKIIFIKTPSQQASAPQIIPVQQQNEEKTIVYVLVKKPEDIQDVVVPKAEQKPPAKPEVFFIKYNNKEDSQAVINNIVKDYSHGQSVSFLGQGVSESSKDTSDILSGPTVQPIITSSPFQSLGINESPEISTAFGSQSFGITGGPSTVSSVTSSDIIGSGVNVNYENVTPIPTSQGVPHETYGIPKFRV
ncbi:uncharacterized protein ACR2FA_003313 [Aphomia sociella]